jgi:hypothetical protein
MDAMPMHGALSYTERGETAYPARLNATIEDAEYASSSFVTNGFSHRGAFLLRPDRRTPLPAVGSRIKLLLHWAVEPDRPPVRVAAKVIRQTTDGVGVRFEIYR